MKKFVWTYGRVTVWIKNERAYILFTTLCPMFNPITAKDYKEYHNNIDAVRKRLGFKQLLGVMIGSRGNIDKTDIQNQLGEYFYDTEIT